MKGYCIAGVLRMVTRGNTSEKCQRGTQVFVSYFLVPQKYPGAAHAPIFILVRSIFLQKDKLLAICCTHACRFEKTVLGITFRIATKNFKLENECF